MRFQIDQTYTPDDAGCARSQTSARFDSDKTGLELLADGLLTLGWKQDAMDDIIEEAAQDIDEDDLAKGNVDGLDHVFLGNSGQYDWSIIPNPEDPPYSSDKLSFDEERYVAEVADKVDYRGDDLYKLLHHVGDDTTKAEIQSALRQVLDCESYQKVVAVFQIAVDPDDVHTEELQRRTYPAKLRAIQARLVELGSAFKAEAVQDSFDTVGVTGLGDYNEVFNVGDLMQSVETAKDASILEFYLREGGEAL